MDASRQFPKLGQLGVPGWTGALRAVENLAVGGKLENGHVGKSIRAEAFGDKFGCLVKALRTALAMEAGDAFEIALGGFAAQFVSERRDVLFRKQMGFLRPHGILEPQLLRRREVVSHFLRRLGFYTGCCNLAGGRYVVLLRATFVAVETITDTQTAIGLENVSRHYAMGDTAIRAVDDVSLTVPTGEFLALLGSSGSGKSTLLNLMAGLDRPTAGKIVAGGRNLAELSSLELARYRRETVGMVFQSFNLLPRMTLEENVELPLRLAEVDREARATRVHEALEHVRLTKRMGHRPSELSGGEQQRTAIARALVNRPKILLADEPTGNLDSSTGEAILTLLREIQSNLGMTIVMVTHERHLAERFADRLATMGDGKLLSTTATYDGSKV